ncbi:MAG: hypothetical protein K0R38_1364 [Polyangiaceae bacterium]|nr:hypothetical protein [Polyangiaceae bacterium]
MKHQAIANITPASRAMRRPLLLAWLAGAAVATACVADETGIPSEPSGNAGEATQTEAGTKSVAGSAGSAVSGGTTSGGGSGSAGAPRGEGGEPGEPPLGSGGVAALGGAFSEPGGGEGGADEPSVAMSCVFHTQAPPPVDATGGAGPVPPAADVVVQQSPFLGAYLTDAAGRTLYTYGADLPGDCESAPVSRCEADCLVSWPTFSGGQRVLGAGLDDAAFGSILRGDGSSQATYYGWPLYYYKADLALGQLTGQGKGKTWHAAELALPSVVIMKAGTAKYLADRNGRTLYVSAGDTPGGSEDPVSSCSGDCLDAFAPFHEKHLSAVSSLEPTDFSVFVRQGKGGLQLAYKGMPLYLAHGDEIAGDLHGTETAGFTAAVP